MNPKYSRGWQITGMDGNSPGSTYVYYAFDNPEILKHASTLLFANTLFNSNILTLENLDNRPRIFWAAPQPSEKAEWILSIEFADSKIQRWEYTSSADAISDLPKHLMREDIEKIDLRHKKQWPPTMEAELGIGGPKTSIPGSKGKSIGEPPGNSN
jgi:hypothetical protein